MNAAPFEQQEPDDTGDMIAWMIRRRLQDRYEVEVSLTDALFLAEQIRAYLRGKL